MQSKVTSGTAVLYSVKSSYKTYIASSTYFSVLTTLYFPLSSFSSTIKLRVLIINLWEVLWHWSSSSRHPQIMNENNDGVLHCRILQLQPWGTCPMAFAVPLHCWLFSNDTLLTHLATLSMCWPVHYWPPTVSWQLGPNVSRHAGAWDQILYLQWHFCATMSSFPIPIDGLELSLIWKCLSANW